MKKVLSLVLVIAMVLSSMSFAVAGTFEDVTDAATSKAVDALNSLGVVDGYEDGTYKPEGSITRAEIAKLLVVALGHGDLAAGSSSSFKDAQGKWYDGYVAVAQSIGVTDGYPDGTFRGDDKVTYAQAITMVMRALGYNNKSVNSNRAEGYNATSYKTMASRLGILTNISLKAGDSNRGDVAVMLYNALEVPVVTVDSDGNPNEIKVSGVARTLIDEIAESDTIAEVVPAMLNAKSEVYMGDKFDLTPYMYQAVKAYFNRAGEVVFVKGTTTKTVEGTLAASGTTTDAQIKIGSAVYPVAAPVKVFYNGEEVEGVTEAQLEGTGITGGVNDLKGAKVTAIITTNATTGVKEVTALIAEKIYTAVKVASDYKANTFMLGAIYLPKDGRNVDVDNITVTGAVDSLEDIKKNDVVYTYPAGGKTTVPNATKLLVVRDSAEGKVTKLDTTNSKVYIDTVGEYKSIAPFATVAFAGFKLQDAGTFYFDKDGKIFAFAAKSTTVTSDYVMVTALGNGAFVGSVTIKDPTIKVMAADGSTKTYTVDLEAVLDGGAVGSAIDSTSVANTYKVNAAKGNIVELTFDADDENLVTAIDVTSPVAGTKVTSNKTITLANDVAVYNVYDSANPNTTATLGTADKFVVSSVEELTNNPVAAGNWSYIANSAGDCVVIIVWVQMEYNSNYAVITSVIGEVVNDKNVQRVTGYLNGEAFEYLTATATTVSTSSFSGKVFDLNLGTDVIKTAAVQTVTDTDGAVTTCSAVTINSQIKFTLSPNSTLGGEQYTVTEETAFYVYDEDGVFERVGSISDLSLINCEVQVFDAGNDTVAEVVLIFQK